MTAYMMDPVFRVSDEPRIIHMQGILVKGKPALLDATGEAPYHAAFDSAATPAAPRNSGTPP
jgi:hypothetical protein